MNIRFILVSCCLALTTPASAQLADRATANWGTMPNGWIDHSGLNRYKTSFGASQHQRAVNQYPVGNRFGGYRYPGGGYPVYVVPGYVYPGVYGVSPYAVGYRCGRCLSPYCVDPFCQGVAVSGLSLTINNGVGFGVVAEPNSGLPWLNRLRQQQAAAFDQQQAAFDAGRQDAFRANLDQHPQIAIDADAAAQIRKKVAELKPSNQAGRERSDQLIAEADKFFSEQQFPKAAQRYRQAVTAAPNYPKAMFRAGHYFMVIGDYENSLLAYLMALEISKDIHQPGFRLDDLYRGNALDKLTHINRLAEVSLKDPEDGGLLMLVGLSLYYDQQLDRSLEFFRLAMELDGPQSLYASWFVRELDR